MTTYISNPYEVVEYDMVDGGGIWYVVGPGCYLGPFYDEDLAGQVACALLTALRTQP